MASVNSNYEFIFVDVGKNGRMSDGGVIEYTDFYNKLQKSELYLPNNSGTVKNLNFVFLGDEAFSLHGHFLKPFAQRDLNYEKRIFNYRLSRARSVSENCFGQITARFRILHTGIHMAPTKIIYIVLAICTLHNFLLKLKTSYATASTFDRYNSDSYDFQHGEWRNKGVELTNLQSATIKNVTTETKANREAYMNYFNNEGRVDWQDRMLKKGRA